MVSHSSPTDTRREETMLRYGCHLVFDNIFKKSITAIAPSGAESLSWSENIPPHTYTGRFWSKEDKL